jgi:2-methylaconitate cis-trans-isomerase PrpF
MTETAEWLEVPATWVRGGTSKCWIFDADRVAATRESVDVLLENAFGAGDARQLDGVGGATSTTSKAMIVRRSDTGDADVEYTFAQVGIGDRVVEWDSNCGNCATAVGLYAVQAGLVPVTGERTVVRMRSANTGSRLDAIVATPGGTAPHSGTARIPGVAGEGVPVGLRFVAPLSRGGGALFPTGRFAETLTAEDRSADATIVDAGAVCALLDAEALGFTGAESIAEFARQVPTLRAFRRVASVAAGLARTIAEARDSVPKVGVVGSPRDYVASDGQAVRAEDYDLAVRMVSMHQPHPAIGLTSAVAVTVAAATPGTTAHARSRQSDLDQLRLGTPAGVLTTRVERDAAGGIRAVVLERAARTLARAVLEVRRGEPAGLDHEAPTPELIHAH